MTTADINTILDREPLLNTDGFDLDLQAVFEPPAQRVARLNQQRQELADDIEGCSHAERFLAAVGKNKTFNPLHTSYGLKQKAERWSDAYISNGAMIVAAIHCGFQVKKTRTLNAVFNVSQRDVLRLSLEGWERQYGKNAKAGLDLISRPAISVGARRPE